MSTRSRDQLTQEEQVLVEQIARVRETGDVNMWDSRGVGHVALAYDWYELGHWIAEHDTGGSKGRAFSEQYVDLLMASGAVGFDEQDNAVWERGA